MKAYAIKGTVGFLFYILYSYCQLVPLEILNIDYSLLSLKIRILYLIIYSLFGMLFFILLFKDDLIKMGNEFIKNRKNFFKNYINYWFYILGAMIVCNIIIINITGNIASNEESIRQAFTTAPIYSMFSACIFAPFVEEMVFRYSLSKVLLNKKLFIIVSGIIFGSLHVVSSFTSPLELLYIIPYGIPGAIFAYLLTKTNNIFNTISIHCIHNTFLMSLQFILFILGNL